ncbi:MAG: 4Fe-4S binding protein [Deltaproteobacteria bacterium]|nr:4Fe-4S binding protein [Deltaproteobacteria bacterium]
MNRVIAWIMGFFFRWLPHRGQRALLAAGRPDEHSPVLVTGNYTLTLRRLFRDIRGRDAWVLSADSGGINVWCAACGGEFTHHQVIQAVKTSRLADKVAHRKLILPALSAPGVDAGQVREKTGFSVRFGPVRAKDIPRYLDDGMQKTPAMRRADFSLRHRLDMLVSMNFIIWLPLALFFGMFLPSAFWGVTALFWGIAGVSYLVFPFLPGRTGYIRMLWVLAALVFLLVAAGTALGAGPLSLWPWMMGGAAITVAVFFDAAGIVAPMASDAEAMLFALGIRRLGGLLREKTLGSVRHNPRRCRACGRCMDVCPLEVFEKDPETQKIRPAKPRACFSCGACKMQCPQGALELEGG